ncbi:hypothetical protein EI94DRAFT_1576850 [Lactarius quietus]|nr:hypothetical protein EI94DRAFT_1576850 [Lactarius quietus]
MEGRPAPDRCSICSSAADIKCPECFGAPSFCRDCCLEAHRRSPFHRPLRWTLTYFTQVFLQSLGFSLFLGHCGAPCPKTVETHQSEPVVSDSLYSGMDALMDSDTSGGSRTCTMTSRNPLLTIVDRNGIFDMEVIFCVCSGGGERDMQLLRSGFFPATFKQIETLFTHSVLDDFITNNLEFKTTAQQYYSKLKSMTSTMFPTSVPVCHSLVLRFESNECTQNRYKQLLRALRQWRDLKNRMKSGIWHQTDGQPVPDGTMAILCPACPQPKINHPKDWKTQYTPYVVIPYLECYGIHIHLYRDHVTSQQGRSANLA